MTKGNLTKNWALAFTLPALITFVATGCAVSTGTSRTSKYNADGSAVTSGTTTTTSSTPTTSTTDSSSTATGTDAPIVFTVSGTGYVSKTVSVRTGKVLRVKFVPGVANQAIAGTGATANYSAMGVYLAVGSASAQATPLLNNGFYGTAQSAVVDLSSALSTTCSSGTDTTCRTSVTITVSKPNLDYYCITSGYYCPYSQAPSTVPWNATLTIQTDDTTAI